MAKTTTKKPARVPQAFFVKELAGEPAPSIETMSTLCEAALEFFTRSPWDTLEETQLVILGQGPGQPECFCSVMGVLGEVCALQVYLGLEGYEFFKRLASGEATEPSDFFGSFSGLSAELSTSAEMEPPEKAMLKAVGFSMLRTKVGPTFRSVRKGYHGWFVNEAEAQLLTSCLQTVTRVHDYVQETGDVSMWDGPDTYAFLPDGGTSFRSRQITAAAKQMPVMPQLEDARIQAIRKQGFKSGRTLQVDHFYTLAMIGAKNERKMCMRIALVIDAETAFAFPPRTFPPDLPVGGALAEVVLQAIELDRAIPREIQVKDHDFKVVLGPLSKALGFPVKVQRNLPALESARTAMAEIMGI